MRPRGYHEAMTGPRVGETVPVGLAEARVIDQRGVSVPLGTFWVSAPCVVVWLRHYGCVGCSEQMTELSPRLDELANADARTVLIGNGTPEQRDDFVARQALADAAVDVVTDPELGTYSAAGLVRSAWATVGPRALWDTARALAAGHPHLSPQGDSTQQGGSMVVDGRGAVVFFKRNRAVGDHASTCSLVDAVLRIAIARHKLVV
jgi:peroxiredoxin